MEGVWWGAEVFLPAIITAAYNDDGDYDATYPCYVLPWLLLLLLLLLLPLLLLLVPLTPFSSRKSALLLLPAISCFPPSLPPTGSWSSQVKSGCSA